MTITPAPAAKPTIAVKPTLVPKVLSKSVQPVKVALKPPLAPKPPPPPIETVNQAEGDPTYDLAGLIPSDEALAAASREFVVPAIALPAPPADVLDYQHAPTGARTRKIPRIDPNTGELSDPMREFIVPLIFFSLGCLLLAAYIFRALGTGPMAELVFGVAVVVLMVMVLIKTGAMIAAAFPLAIYCDVNLGLLRTAVLKFIAVSILAETILLWVDYLLISNGMGSRKVGIPYSWLLYTVLLAFIFQPCFWYVFRIPAIDLKFAALMALVSRLCNFFLLLVLVGVAVSYAANHAPPTVPGTNGATYQSIPASRIPPPMFNSPSPNPGPLASSQSSNGPTPVDTQISWLIHTPRSPVMEGYAWLRLGEKSDESRKVISQMYDAGAMKVYVGGLIMFVQLPDDPGVRAACLEVSRTYRRDVGLGDTPADMSRNYQYIVLNLAFAEFPHKH
jgi:hypothetical protein